MPCNGTDLEAPRNTGEKPCRVDRSIFGDCGNYPFGYSSDNLNPCIIVKVNKIFGFVPELLQPEDVDVVEDLPESVRPAFFLLLPTFFFFETYFLLLAPDKKC